jgi:hypothetical protein
LGYGQAVKASDSDSEIESSNLSSPATEKKRESSRFFNFSQ